MQGEDGDWMVFIEQQQGIFKPQEITLLGVINGLQQISGIRKGQRIAIKGAFFLTSEMAKSGFDPHNH